MVERNGFVFGQVVNAAKILGITSKEVEAYREENKCTTAKALQDLIAQR